MLMPGTVQVLGGSVEHLVQAERIKLEDLSDRIQGKPLRSEMRKLQKQIDEDKRQTQTSPPTSIRTSPPAQHLSSRTVVSNVTTPQRMGVDAVVLDEQSNFALDPYEDFDIPSYVVSGGDEKNDRRQPTKVESPNSSVSLLGSEDDDDDDVEINEIIQQSFSRSAKKKKRRTS